MCKTFNRKVAATVAAVLSLLGVNSCVNEQYEISEERLDLNMTLFQEGLCLPLGSTEKVRLDSILNKLGLEEDFKKYIAAENGAYSFSYRPEEPMDLSEELSALNGVVDIDAIDLSREVAFNLSEVELDGVSYEGATFEAGADLHSMFKDFSIPELEIPTEKFSIASELYKYAEDLNIDLSLGLADAGVQSGEGRMTILTVPSGLSIPPYFTDTTEHPLEWWAQGAGAALELMTNVQNLTVPISYEYRFPKEVRSVRDLHVADGAKIKVTAQIENPFFTSGSVSPHVEINLSSLFDLEDADGKVHDDTIDEDFVLSSTADWKAEDIYGVKGLVLTDDDFVTDEDGYLWLRKSMDLLISSRLVGNDLKTSMTAMQQWLNNHQTDRHVYLKVNVEFVDMHIDDATVEFSPIAVDRVETFDIDVPEIEFPEQIKSADNVVFTDNSYIDVTLSASGLSQLGGLDFVVDDMVVTFPDKLVVEGADAENKVILQGGSMKEGITRQVRLKGINLGQPGADGVIPAYKGNVSVAVKGNVSGSVKTSAIPDSKDEDVILNGSVDTSVEIADYTVTVSGYVVDSQKDPDMFKPQEIKIPVPEDMLSFKGMTVGFKNDPAISIEIQLPQISTPIRPQGSKGLIIKFPKMLSFKDGDYQKWFDASQHALVFSPSEDFPQQIVLPIDRLEINPVKDETDGKYYMTGAVEVVGAVGIAEDTKISKADVDVLSAPGSKVGFKAVVPELVPATADMESYSMELKESIDFEPLKDVQLPEMIAKVGKITFDDVYVTFAVATGKDFPDLGENASLSLGLDVTLPEFVEVDDERYKDGKLTITGQLTRAAGSSSLGLAVDPVKLKALDLNMTHEQLKQLKGSISLEGNINLAGVSVDLDEWMGGYHTVSVTAGIQTIKDGRGTGELAIEQITGNVDYQLDPISIDVDMSALSEYLNGPNFEAVIDIDTFYALLDVTTNLGVPLKADLSIIPYYGNEAGKSEPHKVVLEPAASASEQKTTRLLVSNREPDESQAVNQFVNIDLMSLLYKDEEKTQMADSIKLELNAGTDPSKTCVYEPSAEYNLTVDYSVGVPVAFGEDFEIVYRDTLDLPQEVAMIMEYGALALGGEIESSIPIGFDFSARLLDSHHNELKTSDKPIGMRIPSADASGAPVKADIDLMISNDKKADLSDLKAIELVFKADSKLAPGVQLREDNFLRAVLYALIPQGVTIDAAELMQQEETDNE